MKLNGIKKNQGSIYDNMDYDTAVKATRTFLQNI